MKSRQQNTKRINKNSFEMYSICSKDPSVLQTHHIHLQLQSYCCYLKSLKFLMSFKIRECKDRVLPPGYREFVCPNTVFHHSLCEIQAPSLTANSNFPLLCIKQFPRPLGKSLNPWSVMVDSVHIVSFQLQDTV